jgi:hypothetical protein
MGDRLKPLPFVVVGPAYNGASSMLGWLLAAGVNATHQGIFTQHGLRYAEVKREAQPDVECDVSWMAAPYLSATPILRISCIVHLMRNPWHVLQSLVDSSYVFGDVQGLADRPCPALFLEKEFPRIYKESSAARRAAEYIIAWDELLHYEYAARHVLCHRIEDDANQLLDRMRAVQESKRWLETLPPVAINPVAWQPEPKSGYNLKHDLTCRQVSKLYTMAEAWGYQCEF